MRKSLSILSLASILAILVVPIMVLAQQAAPDTCTIKRDLDDITGDSACTVAQNPISVTDHGMCCLMNTLYNITDWIYDILVALVAIFVILGAFTILTAAGAPEKITSGRNYILYAAIGLLVAFLAKAVPGVVKMVSGF